MAGNKKLIKYECELLCGVVDPNLLQKHHILERTDLSTTNDDYNLVVLCANCHLSIHNRKIKIIGLFPSTRPPNGRTLVFESLGQQNVVEREGEPVLVPPYRPKNRSIKIK